jgi:hypothetical protein
MTGILSGRLFMINSFLPLPYSPASWHASAMEYSVKTRKKLKKFIPDFIHSPLDCESVDLLALAGLDARRAEKDSG